MNYVNIAISTGPAVNNPSPVQALAESFSLNTAKQFSAYLTEVIVELRFLKRSSNNLSPMSG